MLFEVGLTLRTANVSISFEKSFGELMASFSYGRVPPLQGTKPAGKHNRSKSLVECELTVGVPTSFATGASLFDNCFGRNLFKVCETIGSLEKSLFDPKNSEGL